MLFVCYKYARQIFVVGLSPELVSELNQKAVVMSATQCLVLGRAAVSLEHSLNSSPVMKSGCHSVCV